MQIDTTHLIPLSIPVPPDPLLEQALGYNRQARFFATWWQPEGDEAMFSDGIVSGTGLWIGYLAYVQHDRVFAGLAHYDLGGSDRPAKHWLVIDRQERKAYIAWPAEAREFLAHQWPQRVVSLDIPEMEQLIQTINRWLAENSRATVGDALAWMEVNQQAVDALLAWLNEPGDNGRSSA